LVKNERDIEMAIEDEIQKFREYGVPIDKEY
jgi:biotin operon repressor